VFSANALSRSRALPAGRSNMAKQSGESQVIVKWDTATFENYLSARARNLRPCGAVGGFLQGRVTLLLKGW
jgi:hypothetical protein